VRKTFFGLAALATALVPGVASAQGMTDVSSDVNGGWSNAPFAVTSPQSGLIITNGAPLVDARCAAPWTDGPAAGAVGTRYNACNQAPVGQNEYASGHFIG
jgi:hypothetical protein